MHRHATMQLQQAAETSLQVVKTPMTERKSGNEAARMCGCVCCCSTRYMWKNLVHTHTHAPTQLLVNKYESDTIAPTYRTIVLRGREGGPSVRVEFGFLLQV